MSGIDASKNRSDLSRFFYATLSSSASVEKAPDWKIWPMPLPFPEVFRRKANRRQLDIGRKLGVNFLVLVLNWLHWGGRGDFPFGSVGLGTKLNAKQWSVARRFADWVDVWNKHAEVDASSMGRSAAKVESIEEVLRSLSETVQCWGGDFGGYSGGSPPAGEQLSTRYGHPGVSVGTLASSVDSLAKEVEPDRIQFYEVPSFDPVPYLDDANRERFQEPLSFACAAGDLVVPIPSVRLRCSKGDQVRLLEKLDGCSRLRLLPQRKVRLGLECGLFSIPKDAERDRLIMDARPANLCENSEDRWVRSLGSLQQFQHFFLEDHQRLVMHCEDIRDFYHAFIIGEQRCIRNALRTTVTPSEVRHLQCFTRELEDEAELIPALSTMAMGDTNSVAFGQAAHLSLLLRTGAFELEDFISLKLRPSRKSWHCGVMIDDFILFEALEKTEPLDEGAGRAKVQAVRDAYETAGLPRHPGKAVSCSTDAEFWGAQFDGEAGQARPNLKRLIPLAHVILKVVELKHATVGLLEVLAGSLVSAFQMRRRTMSVLEEIYAAQRGRERNEIVRLSPQLLDELMTSVAMLPAVVLDFRIKPADRLIASDSSEVAEAAVCADVTPAFTLEAQRHALQKGLWNRLLGSGQAYLREKGQLPEDEELPQENYDMHFLWREAVETLQFQQFGKVRNRRRRKHINLGEVSAALAAEKLHGLQQPDTFYIHLQDSQVSLACLVKGRSSSHQINCLLRQSLADHLSSNVRPFYGYVRSKLNPADDPTRAASLRGPVRNGAGWFVRALEGSFGEMDQELEERGLSLLQISGLPDPSELLPDAEIDDSTSAKRKTARAKGNGSRTCVSGVSKEVEKGKCPLPSSTSPQKEESPSSSFSLRPLKLLPKRECLSSPSSLKPMQTLPSTKFLESSISLEGSEKKGGGTAGSGEIRAAALLRKFRRDQFIFSSSFSSLEEAIAAGPGLLDLFSGSRGFATSFVKRHSTWAVCFDLAHSSSEDLLDPQLQSDLQMFLGSGAFLAMACSPVCASFSTAITPPWRTCEYPEGRPDLTELQKAKVKLGQMQLEFTLRLVRICINAGVIFWVENPDSSWFWRQKGKLAWTGILDLQGVGLFRCD